MSEKSSKTIFSVFAGRRANIQIQRLYLEKLFKQGDLDEVHYWDYCRNPEDSDFLASLGFIKHVPGNLEKYFIDLENLVDKESQSLECQLVTKPCYKSKILDKINLHFKTSSGKEFSLKIDSNTISFVQGSNVLIQRPRKDLRAEEKQASSSSKDESKEIKKALANPLIESIKNLKTKDEDPIQDILKLKLKLIFQPITNSIQIYIGDDSESPIFLHFSNDDSDLVLTLHISSEKHDLMIDWKRKKETETLYDKTFIFGTYDKGVRWSSYYSHYHKYRKFLYSNIVLVKSDDDILYIDTLEFRKAIEYRKRFEKSSFCFLANVINNEVCAHLQFNQCKEFQDRGIPDYQFEYPKNGLGGSLWESGSKANKLQNDFLEKMIEDPNSQYLKLLQKFDVNSRVSINFLIFTSYHLDWFIECVGDDEKSISQCIPEKYPQFKHREIFGPLRVAHLSFYKQEQTGEKGWSCELREKYKILASKL
jgi:hypothetical protein